MIVLGIPENHGGLMRNRLAVIFAVLVLFSAMTALSFAAEEEELFDTQTATEHIEKGLKLLRAKNIDAAIEELEAAVSAAPSAEAYYYLGYAYYLKGKSGDEDSRQKAAENFEEAYDLDPNFSPNKVGPGTVIEAPPALQQGESATAEPAQPPAPEPAPESEQTPSGPAAQ
jgi:tetratricopeptide (TPR) repeat protein